MTLDLSADEALVLFEFLSRWDETGTFDLVDQAEQRVLWDVLAGLEGQLTEPFSPDYGALVAAARTRLRDSEL